jgi:ABC-type polysaccharide/polyol phosphate export permease
MRRLTADLAGSLRNPEFWALSSWLDIVVRYRQSRLGMFWLITPAIVYIWGVGAAFAKLMGFPLVEYATHVGLGYLVLRMISSVVIESTSAFAASSPFILDGHVRLTDFVLRVIAKALFYFVAALPVLVVALAVYPDPQWAGLVPAGAAFLLIIVNAVWIGTVCGLIGARFPDLGQLVANIFMFTFLLTPIIWHASTMPPDSLRGTLMRLNPFFHMIELVRAPLVGDLVEWGSLYYLGAMTVIGWSIAAFAYRRFARFVPLWV